MSPWPNLDLQELYKGVNPPEGTCCKHGFKGLQTFYLGRLYTYDLFVPQNAMCKGKHCGM